MLALAVTTPQRAASLPNLPSIAQVGSVIGLANFDVSTWFGIFAPAGTPPSVITNLNLAIRNTLANAANAERLKTLGSDVAALEPAAFARFVGNEHSKYAAIVRAANIRID